MLGLKLERSVDPLPKDSTVLIRPRSALGLKYVELTRGRVERGLRGRRHDPARPGHARARRVRRLHRTCSTTDTRAAAQTNLEGFGDALAGRGGSINQAIGAFRPLLRDIIPVAQNLSSAETNLPRFVSELADTARIVAPAAESQAQLFVDLDRTFAALRAVARPYIQDVDLRGSRDARRGDRRAAAPAAVPGQHRGPVPRAAARASRALRGAAPDLADALEVGTPTLRRTPPFNRRLASLLTELETFGEDPLVPRGVRRLTDTVRTLNPTLQLPRAGADDLQLRRALVPQHRLAALRGRPATAPGSASSSSPRRRARTAEGGPASAPADGPTLENHLHSNPYPNTAAPGQPRECEAGNEPYLQGRAVTGNAPGTQQAATEGTP